jgi:hypothetical protein
VVPLGYVGRATENAFEIPLSQKKVVRNGQDISGICQSFRQTLPVEDDHV